MLQVFLKCHTTFLYRQKDYDQVRLKVAVQLSTTRQVTCVIFFSKTVHMILQQSKWKRTMK